MQRLAPKRETVIAREVPMSLHATCRKPARVTAMLAALGLALSIAPHRALGFERYNDGCQSCHGNFASGGYTSRATGRAWPSSRHTMIPSPLEGSTTASRPDRTSRSAPVISSRGRAGC